MKGIPTPRAPDVRARQTPLRSRYREQPSAALVVDHACIDGRDLHDPLHGRVRTGSSATADIDFAVHHAIGGLHDAPVPGDLLCAALASCQESSLRMTRLRELAEIRSKVKGASKARQAIDGSAYFLMLRAQQLVDVPTWWGAYEKAIAAGNAETRAVAMADQAVIDSQGSGTTKDLSAIERGGPALKLFTTFYSFFNVTLNNAVAQTMTNESKAKTAADYMLLFVVPVILAAALKSALTPGDSGDDDPEKLAKRLIGEEISFMFGLMFGVREISGAVQAATGTAQYGTDYSGPAGLRPISDLARLGKQVNQGEADNALRKAVINTAGQLLRLPAAQINRSITGAQALADGKTSNPAALVMGYEEPR